MIIAVRWKETHEEGLLIFTLDNEVQNKIH